MEMEGSIREGCERQVCHMIICNDYERKECAHGGKEKFNEQYSPANTDTWIRNLDVD